MSNSLAPFSSQPRITVTRPRDVPRPLGNSLARMGQSTQVAEAGILALSYLHDRAQITVAGSLVSGQLIRTGAEVHGMLTPTLHRALDDLADEYIEDVKSLFRGTAGLMIGQVERTQRRIYNPPFYGLLGE